MQRVQVNLKEIKSEFNSGSTYTPFIFLQPLPLKWEGHFLENI